MERKTLYKRCKDCFTALSKEETHWLTIETTTSITHFSLCVKCFSKMKEDE